MIPNILKKEKFASIYEAQAGLSKLVKKAEKEDSFIRLMKHNKPVGVLIPNKTWESILEDLEAHDSPQYVREIKEARKDKKLYSAADVKKMLDIPTK